MWGDLDNNYTLWIHLILVWSPLLLVAQLSPLLPMSGLPPLALHLGLSRRMLSSRHGDRIRMTSGTGPPWWGLALGPGMYVGTVAADLSPRARRRIS